MPHNSFEGGEWWLKTWKHLKTWFLGTRRLDKCKLVLFSVPGRAAYHSFPLWDRLILFPLSLNPPAGGWPRSSLHYWDVCHYLHQRRYQLLFYFFLTGIHPPDFTLILHLHVWRAIRYLTTILQRFVQYNISQFPHFWDTPFFWIFLQVPVGRRSRATTSPRTVPRPPVPSFTCSRDARMKDPAPPRSSQVRWFHDHGPGKVFFQKWMVNQRYVNQPPQKMEG